MSDRIRSLLVDAIRAAGAGIQPTPPVERAVLEGDTTMRLDELGFDSLAWMEFCISVELQSGQELMPADIEGMHHFCEIERWLRIRL